MKKNYGKRNRQIGHDAERNTAKEFREIGYPHCKTSRQASRLLDDSKIDLAFIPFNIQIKAGAQRGFNAIKELKAMEKSIIKNLPPKHEVHKYPNIVLLRKATGKGNKRTKYDDTVTMSWEDFQQLIRKEKK